MVTRTQEDEFEFRFFRPQARIVSLVGDFNGWNEAASPMDHKPNGEWVRRIRLPRGVYEFKYLADGEWYIDHAAFGLALGPFGWNAVVVV